MDITCKNCGAKLSEADVFCASCGTKVEKEPQKRFCSQCGTEVAEGLKFCMKCGNPVAEVKPAGDGMKEASKAVEQVVEKTVASVSKHVNAENGKKLLNKKVLIGVGVAVVLLLIILFIPKGGKGGFRTPEEAFEANLNGYTTQDYDLMLESYPEFRIEYGGGEEMIKADCAVTHQNDFGEFDATGMTLVFEAKGHTIGTESECTDLEQQINSVFNADADLEEMAYIDYDMVYYQDGEEIQRSSMSGGYAAKYDGRWYYFNWE